MEKRTKTQIAPESIGVDIWYIFRMGYHRA